MNYTFVQFSHLWYNRFNNVSIWRCGVPVSVSYQIETPEQVKSSRFFPIIIIFITISMQNIGTIEFLHTFAHFILYFVSGKKTEISYFSWCRIHAPMFMDDCKMPLWNVHPIYYPEMTIFTHGRFALILIILHSNWPWNGYVFFWKAFDENILGIWHWMAESALHDLPVNLRTWISDIIKISSCQTKPFLSPQIFPSKE